MVIGRAKEVKGSAVAVRWEPPFEGICPVERYHVFYREVISPTEKSKWNLRTVSGNTTSFTLYLDCWKEYDVTVTSLNAYRESEVSASNIWNFKITSGKTSLMTTFIRGF